MNIDLESIDGNKTYIALLIYMGYHLAIQRGWLSPIAGVDDAIKTAVGLAFAHKVQKLVNASNGATPSATPTPPTTP